MSTSPPKPVTVLYHGNCPDGYAAAYACWQVYGDAAQYLPVFYGQPIPPIPLEHTTYIVDFSYPAETIKAFLYGRIHERRGENPQVIVLDHHASAERELSPLQRQQLPGLLIDFDMDESGATLTWKYLHRLRAESPWQAVPMFFQYVRDRDLWQWALPDSKAVSLAYWSIPKDFESIHAFAQQMDDEEGFVTIVLQGRAMERYAESLVKEQAARAFGGVIGGYEVPIVNATTLFSEVGDYLCTTQPAIPFCAYFFDRSDGKRQWGLRGHGKVDLSVVAHSYGGGGHANAAGFVTEQGWLPLLLEDPAS